MQVTIDDGLYEELKRLAERRKRQVDEMVNQAVDEFCKKHDQLPGNAAPGGYGLQPKDRKSSLSAEGSAPDF